MPKLTYRAAGVDINSGNLLVQRIKPIAETTSRDGAKPNIGGFAGLFDPKAAGFKDPLLMAATDGVGSKLKIAAAMQNYETIGIDLVAMCVNDLIVRGVEPLVFLDYLACGKLKLPMAEQLIGGIAQGCKIANCALIGGEVAEMPGIYDNSDYDLAGFTVGAVERNKLLPEKNGTAGDIIIALPSSGIHANGFSLMRKFLEIQNISLQDRTPFAEKSWGQYLLTPTRIYVKAILAALKQNIPVKAMAHITGGGIAENIQRSLPQNIGADINIVKATEKFPIFRYLHENGISESELLRTFNCGIGWTMVIDEKHADKLINNLRQNDENPIAIGNLIKGKTKVKIFAK